VLASLLYLFLGLASLLAGAGLLFLLITRRARTPMDDSHD